MFLNSTWYIRKHSYLVPERRFLGPRLAASGSSIRELPRGDELNSLNRSIIPQYAIWSAPNAKSFKGKQNSPPQASNGRMTSTTDLPLPLPGTRANHQRL